MRSVLFILLLSFCSSISCEGYFTVIGSKLIRQRTKYHVSVTSQGYDEPQILEIAIRNTKKSDNKYEVVQNVTLVNGEAQKVEFDLKGQPMVDYSLEVKSLSGNDFSKTVKLNMNTKKNSVLVQTDKSMYKPSDKIQFRVLALNADMKPLIIRKVQVFITDGAQNRVKQFNDVKMTKGVYQNELQLSDSPVMGMWKINVKINNDKEVSKEFEVAEYTLPKFEVTIDANPDANFKDGKIRATVRATYTFGKIAKGNATVTAEVPNPDRWNRHRGRKVSRAIEINGKKSIEFDIKNDLDIRDTGKEVTVKLRATFTEELTGRDQNATAEVTIHITPHKIEMRKSSERIKPGLPFSATAIVKHHDKGAPVSDPYNSVKFTIKYHYDTVKTCERRNYYNGFGPQFGSRPFERSPIGYPQFGYPQFGSSQIGTESYSCRQEHSYEKIKEGFLTDGMSEIDIDIPSNTTKIDVTAKYLETKETVENIKRQESESKEYIQVKAATKNPKISENVKIDVLATTNIVQLTYQVIGKGDVIVSQNVPVPNAKSFSFEFLPTLAMIPKASVIVFYITSSGEIISDSLKIEFATELKNFVNIELSKDQVKPGDSLEISVSSKANSYVGLLGVDQSVLLLKKGNDIEKSTVFEEIKKYNEVNRENQIYDYSYDYKTHKDFEISDAVIITNAKKEYERPYVPMESPYGYRDFPMYSMRPQPYYPMGFGGFGGSATSASASSQSFGLSVPMPNSVSYQSMDRRYEDKIAEMKPMVSVPVKPKVIEIRKTFPETWIFDSFDFNSTTTNVKLSKKVPDTITSWIITAFSIDPNTGLGLARQPSKFNVFQPFFVSTNLPYSIKRGEVVSIPILVFNYLEGDQEAEVTLFNSEGEFEFVEKKENVNQVNKRKRAIETQRKKTVLVKSQSGLTVPFMIRPLKVGHITIKVTASSAVAGDGVERQLIVEPEGVTQYMNKAVFIDLRNNPEFKMNFNIEIPSNAVPDSTKIEASAIGDILGPSLDNLDALIKLPYGCGEQNMLNFVPNIVVLDYLTTLNLLTPEIESKAKTYLESGYQRELTYKHDDGSYSVFGRSDKSGSTWLTAFVAKSFNQALKYIAIDEEIIKKALSFLSKVQRSDGSFPEVGYVFDKAMQGGSSKGIGLTAYTLITFLENEKLGKIYQTTIDRAINFIKQNLDSLDDNYSLAIASYAMQLAKHGSKDSLLAKLDAKSVTKNGMKHWEKAVPKSDENSPWSYRPNSVNVEMSAYGLQALVEANRESDAVQVMKWLVTQRNENGGFQSTQDTVVGLQALAKLAMKIYVADSNIDIELKPSSNNNILFNVNAENALVLQKHDVQSEARTFEVSAKGNGFGVLQLSYKYNLNINGEWPRFIVMPEVHQNSNKDFLHLVVCTNFVTDDSDVKSNMAVMEVSFPSGFTFDSDSRSDLLLTEKVKKVETKDGDTIVVVYFESLSAKKICPELKAYRTHSVSKQKPVPVKVYDYYDNSRQATNFYNPPEVSLCDICDGDEECIEDCEEMEINVD